MNFTIKSQDVLCSWHASPWVIHRIEMQFLCTCVPFLTIFVLQAPVSHIPNLNTIALRNCEIQSAQKRFSFIEQCITIYRTQLVNPGHFKKFGAKHNKVILPYRSIVNQQVAIPYHKLTGCVVSEKKCNTREGKSNSIAFVLYILWLMKRHVFGQTDKATVNSDKLHFRGLSLTYQWCIASFPSRTAKFTAFLTSSAE